MFQQQDDIGAEGGEELADFGLPHHLGEEDGVDMGNIVRVDVHQAAGGNDGQSVDPVDYTDQVECGIDAGKRRISLIIL